MSRQYVGRSSDRKVSVSGELFALTYGALVAQLVKDYETDDEINKQLNKMMRLVQIYLISLGSRSMSKGCAQGVEGYNIGIRLIEDFLARFPDIGRCYDLKSTADILAKQGFKTFLGIVPLVANWNAKGDEFSLILEYNPLSDFVELSEDHPNLLYSNIICGVLRGALEMVQLDVDVWFVQDTLKGDDTTEIRLKLNKRLEDAVPAGED